MKVLVTGATGLIGRQLCTKLLEKNHDLVVLGRSSEESFRKSFSLPCEYLMWTHLAQMPQVDAVIHLAGESIADGLWTKAKKKRILESRTNTTASLVEQLQKKPPKCFISASAVGFYGDRGDSLLDETSKRGTGFLADVCHLWEQATEPLRPQTRLVQPRLGVVFANNGGFLTPMHELFCNRLGGTVGSGDQYLSWIHIDDLVDMLVFALENSEVTGVYNAVAPTPLTNAQFTSTYAKTLGVSAFMPAPAFALKLALGEKSSLALDSTRASSKKIQDAGFSFKYSEAASALKDLYSWKQNPNQKLFYAEQWVKGELQEVFRFFSEAKNLEKITPPWLNFKVLDVSSETIQEGTIINYKLSLHGLPLKWQTRIVNWNPPHEFVDDQVKGPYKKWYHSHKFKSLKGGVLLSDHVVFELPMGWLGRAAAGAYVKNDVQKIFSYRQKIIGELFG